MKKKEKNTTDKLYAKLLIFAEELHMGNKRRIRNGFISLAVMPVILVIIRLLTESSRVVFLILWIISMFVAAAFLIFVAFVDRQLQDTLNELSQTEKQEFDSLLAINGRSIAKPRTKPAEKALVKVEQPPEPSKPEAKPIEKAIEKAVEKPVAQAVEKAVEQVVEKAVEQVVEKAVAQAVEKAVAQAVEKAVAQVTGQTAAAAQKQAAENTPVQADGKADEK